MHNGGSLSTLRAGVSTLSANAWAR